MPKAAEALTIPFTERPTGIFSEVSGGRRRIDLVAAVHSRLDNIAALLFVVSCSDDLDPIVKNAITAIETALVDATALLSVHVPGEAA